MIYYKLDINNHNNVKLNKVNKIQEKKYQILKNSNTFIVIAYTNNSFFLYGDDNLVNLCHIMKTYLKSNANNFLIGMIFSKDIDRFIIHNYISRFKFLLLSMFCFFGSLFFQTSKENVVRYHYCNDLHKCIKKYKGIK